MCEYLDSLNPEQQQAVLHDGKSLLILAGAGSGKTRVITTKIAYLIRERGFPPASILAVTFTNKAAREMAARASRIEARACGAMLKTFHSFGAWFLRRNAALAGLHPGFVIYDDDDAVSLLGTLLEDTPKIELRKIAADISRAKDYFLSPEDPELDLVDHTPGFRGLYARYEEKKRKIGNVDFGDLIKMPVEILRNNAGLAAGLRDRFSVIMVDEYQDSNVAQFRLLYELKGKTTYLCAVGDDDQSIYRFRGAEVKNILEFPDRFPGTDIIRLERNYRSFAPILNLASQVVNHNSGRLGKTLTACRAGGKKPVLAFLPDQDEEARFCAELIGRSVTDAGPERARYSDWAIFYRTNAQSRGFETELVWRRIPYRVVGSLKFYEREEIKDALALFALLANPRDEVAFRRMVNKPARGIGGASVEKIIDVFEKQFLFSEKGLLEAARQAALSPKAAAGVKVFAGVLDRGRALLAGKADRLSARMPLKSGEGLSVCAAALICDSGLAGYHSSHDEVNGYQRTENLQELVDAASLYPASMDGLAEFLEHIELDRSIEEKNRPEDFDAVTLITLHNTKGLEFRRVVLTGLEQGIFPRDDKEADDLEEERRLFYVGVTRAMDELYLCSCAMRRMYGRTQPMLPSLFLREADKSLLRIIGAAPAGFGAGKGGAAGTHGQAGCGTGYGGYGAENGGYGAVTGKSSSDGRWKQGERVFHDDQGYGSIAGIEEGEDGPVIKVRFDNGHETRFLSTYQSSKFTKIGSED
ncbi:MAG: ATP-dependent helicase [Treponema sp.]|jgi:DNA helicase-2/ATP-dependent DNA helicase PcrA|nr:ATP-dependent helicase [Treponema sp.]